MEKQTIKSIAKIAHITDKTVVLRCSNGKLYVLPKSEIDYSEKRDVKIDAVVSFCPVKNSQAINGIVLFK